MSGFSGNQQDVDIDLGGLFRAIWRRRTRVLLTTVAVAALAFTAAHMISPRYDSEARLLIEPREPEFSSMTLQPSAASATSFDEPGISSEVQLLRSVDLIKQVARNMRLHELKEFDPTADPSAISDILVMLGLKRNPLDMPPEERVLKEFQEKLQVYQVEKSRVIGIQFTSKDRALAAAIPNEMAKIYLSLKAGAKLDSNTEASRWLEPEIANLREKVRAAEAKIADYRSSADLLPSGDTGTFATRQLTDISTELARVRGERATAEARAENVRAALSSGRGADTLNEVVGSAMIQRLKESESQIQNQIADLSTTLLEGHPRIKALRSQLTGIRAQIREETQKILASLENEAKVGELRERQLTQQMNTLKASSAKAGEDEVGLRALEREAAAQRQLLETYLSRYREASSRTGASAAPADARVISSAVAPTEASFPKILPITIVAGLAAFLLSCVVILLQELFSGRALRPVGAPVPVPLAVATQPVPPTPLPPAPAPKRAWSFRQKPAPGESGREITRPAAAGPDLAVASAAAIPAEEDREEQHPEAEVPLDGFFVENVAAALILDQVPLAFVVSPTGDAGSAQTVALARMVAEEGRRVVLIDLTASGCPTGQMAMSAGLPGITNLLAQDIPFADALHADRGSDAHIVPSGTADPALAMQDIDRLQAIIEALTDAYDLVLVDCADADAAAVSRLARVGDIEIIFSVPAVSAEDMVEIITEFAEAGYDRIQIMEASLADRPVANTPLPEPGRRAA
ncbi:chain-length determining protein [Rhizobium sp. Leaf371]|uniref:GumC family protein n=1 Tax=Rhizobium sp. Leaf371 TaxID=1736355 RepID=UPI0007161C4B|nr:Wzz/FepE/Etk N-terminal domain-containing protein [Rhizobium sp. Leaf371]KQS63455.1 chain-length determining protein [Rhizobium sp. Leaf371]